jgi:tetratricopeptide (TPR) repeat protein
VALDKEKIISSALRFVQKGQLDKGLKEYLRILESEPNEVRILLRVGELCARMGDSPTAIDMYMRVADIYTTQGFFLKAVAVYKNVLKINENHFLAYEKLADLYVQLGLLSDAKQQYSLLADIHEKAGRGHELLSTLKRMIDLDPSDILSRVKLGEMFAREGHMHEAAEELLVAANALKTQGRLEEYTRVAERYFGLNPNAVDIGTELASICLERRDPKKALQKLQACYKANPNDVRTLELLAESFGQLDMPHNQIPAYKELLKIYRESNRTAEAAVVERKLRELAPEEVPDAFAPVGAQPPPPETAPQPEPEPAVQPPSAPVPAVVPPPPAPVSFKTAAAGYSEKSARLLTETDIYIKYGLNQKALDTLHQILEEEPGNFEARRRLGYVYGRMGNLDDGVAEMRELAVRLLGAGEVDEAKSTLFSILEIRPDEPAVMTALQLLDSGADVDSVIAAVSAPMPEKEEKVYEIDRPVEEFEVEIADEHGGPAGEMPLEEPILATELEITDEEPALEPAAQESGREAGEAITFEIEAEPPAPAVREPEPAPAAVEEEEAKQEFDGDYEEALFLFEQGLIDKSKELCEKIIARDPEHTRAAELAQKIESMVHGLTVQKPQVEPAEDLKNVIEEMPPPAREPEGQVELGEILTKFRKSVSETISPGDARTHYDLGCAYREMGLYQDALNEFKATMANEEWELRALHMMAVCYLESGEQEKAINALKKALYYDEITPEQTVDFLYEIGLAYETLGDPEEALYYFKKVAKKQPGYRDLAIHMEKIQQGGKQQQP